MNISKCAFSIVLAAVAVPAWSDASIALYGRAGMPVGSDRHAYIVDTARPPSFDAQLQADAGAGRAGGPATLVLAHVQPARTGMARGEDRTLAMAYGRAGYVPEYLALSAGHSGASPLTGASQGASAERTR